MLNKKVLVMAFLLAVVLLGFVMSSGFAAADPNTPQASRSIIKPRRRHAEAPVNQVAGWLKAVQRPELAWVKSDKRLPDMAFVKKESKRPRLMAWVKSDKRLPDMAFVKKGSKGHSTKG